ncbi:type IV pilus assembly protein PilM [Candidatus Saccharibacteria bacterium]|nr:type IV pilus assembly protein PilM [Candidatus Saccharibacteria bacterium]
MKLFETVGDFFALDIGTTAVRALELRGAPGSWSLVRYGSAPVDMKVATSDSPEDRKRLAEVISNLITQAGITTKNVAVGIPSNKTFVTIVDLPDVSHAELASTIKYQAEQYIPMSLEEAKVDWSSLGKSMREENKVEVLLASVANKFSEDRLDLIEGIGLNVVAFEPDSIALVRSLVPAGANPASGALIMDIGDFSTDIVAVIGNTPRLVRSLPTGMQTLIKATEQNLSIDSAQASQFILKFGLYPDRLEGQIYKALEGSLEQFVAEVNKTVKFFQTRYPNVPIGQCILSGYAVSVPAFNEYMTSKTSLPMVVGNPWQQIHYSTDQEQNLLQLAPKFAVAAGLAQRSA